MSLVPGGLSWLVMETQLLQMCLLQLLPTARGPRGPVSCIRTCTEATNWLQAELLHGSTSMAEITVVWALCWFPFESVWSVIQATGVTVMKYAEVKDLRVTTLHMFCCRLIVNTCITGGSRVTCVFSLMFFFRFLCCSDFESLKKDDVYENNKLVRLVHVLGFDVWRFVSMYKHKVR